MGEFWQAPGRVSSLHAEPCGSRHTWAEVWRLREIQRITLAYPRHKLCHPGQEDKVSLARASRKARWTVPGDHTSHWHPHWPCSTAECVVLPEWRTVVPGITCPSGFLALCLLWALGAHALTQPLALDWATSSTFVGGKHLLCVPYWPNWAPGWLLPVLSGLRLLCFSSTGERGMTWSIRSEEPCNIVPGAMPCG